MTSCFSAGLGDLVSTWLGSPPHHWKKKEVQQIKQIQRCFKNAYSAPETMIVDQSIDVMQGFDLGGEAVDATLKDPKTITVPGVEKIATSDAEAYLPKDSPLRSKNSDKKVPGNCPFKDFSDFEQTCGFDYWRHHYEQDTSDKLLSDSAQTIVSNICLLQSKKEIKVRNGYMPGRKKREHITPLALVLHEIKLWCTNTLRTADIYSPDTIQEINCRIKYFELLSRKEVWGDPIWIFGSGINKTTENKLFRLLLNNKDNLGRIFEYSVREFNRRSSREKLSKAGNKLKDVVLNEMRMVSNRMNLTKELSDPATARLQPSDLLNDIENQYFVDYSNMVNVLIWKLCQLPLVAASLNGNYDRKGLKNMISEIESWNVKNLFCVDSGTKKPKYKFDTRRERTILPAIFKQSRNQLKKLLLKADSSATVPAGAKAQVNALKCFTPESTAIEIVKLMLKNLAGIQDLIPSIFGLHQLWSLAGEGGDFTVYDTLREEVIQVMTKTLTRVKAVKASGAALAKKIAECAKAEEAKMKKEAIQARKTKYNPPWILNHHFIAAELTTAYEKTYNGTFKLLYEIRKDAKDYHLKTDDMDNKIEETKKMLQAIAGDGNKTPVAVVVAEVVDEEDDDENSIAKEKPAEETKPFPRLQKLKKWVNGEDTEEKRSENEKKEEEVEVGGVIKDSEETKPFPRLQKLRKWVKGEGDKKP